MRNIAIFAVIALCIASFSVANGGSLAGLRPNLAATEGNREDRFDIVTINPTTGVAASTQKQVYALWDGAIDLTNVLFTPTGMVFSLQAYDQSQSHYHFVQQNVGSPLTPNFQSSNPSAPSTAPGYLARQDLKANGKFEYCELSVNSRPINMFLDNDNGVIAVVANPTTSGFSFTRISFDVATGSQCRNTLISNLPAIGTISINVFHQRGNRVYIVNEPSNGFTTAAAGVQVRSYDIGSVATAIATVTLPSTIIPVTLGATSADVIVFNAYNSALSGSTAGFATYELNMSTYTSATVLSSRTITTSFEELSFTATMLNGNTSYSIKNTATTFGAFVPQLVWTSLTSATTSEQKATSTMGTTAQVFRFFELGNAANVDISIDSTTATSFALTGLNTFASVSSGLGVFAGTIAQCRLTYVGGSITPVVGAATGSGDAASCAIGSIPAGTTSVDVEFAADGVNWGPKNSFSYQLANTNAITNGNFVRSTYNLRDATPLGRGADVVTFIARDTAGRKVLFHPSTSITLSLAPQGQTVLRNVVGQTAVVVNGVASFPNLAIDIDVSESNNVGIVRASVIVGTNTISTTLAIRQLRRTFGTLAALAFPTSTNAQVFETHLINPSLAGTALAAVRLTTRALSETGATLGLGATTYDYDNKVLNTLEVNNAGTVILNGVSMGPSSSNTAGTGICKLPTSTVTSTNTGNDIPSNIFYESTSATGTNFLGVVHFTENTPLGFGRKIVRYTRAAGSIATTACTTVTIDNVPLWDIQFGNHHVQLLSGNRMAFIEPDYFFTASNALNGVGSLLHVWQMSNGTANTGSWLVRNKVLSGFSILGVTQSGEDELAINGISSDSTAFQGVWTIDISSQLGAVNAPTAATASRFASTANEQTLFLSAGSADGNNDSRLRYTGSVTAYTTATQAQFIDTVQLSRGLNTPSPARNVDHSGRNYLDFFVLEDPSVQSITPSRISLNQVAAITVTANNVITSSQLKCRFSSASGVPTAVVVDVGTASTTTAINSDGASVSCGSIPVSFTGSNSWVYVQLSNDGGLNYGPERRLAVGTITDAVNPTTVTTTTSTIFTVAFNIKFLTNLRTPTTAQDTAVRTAITSVMNTLASYWTKSAISSNVESDGTTSYTITVTTTTSSSARMSALQLTTSTSTQLQQELSSAVKPNGVLNSVLSAAGVTDTQITRAAVASSTSSSKDLSDGAIAGIVIGSIVGFFLIVGIIAFLFASNKKATSTPYSPAARARSADVGVVSNSSSGSSSSSSSASSDDDDYYYDDDYSDDDYSDYI